MTNKTAYIHHSYCRCQCDVLSGPVLTILIAFLFLLPFCSPAQDEPEFEELTFFLNVPRVGGFEVPGLIRGDEIYLSPSDLFEFLHIRNTVSSGFDSVTGFFLHPDATYLIDRGANTITFRGKTNTLNPDDLIRTETGIYLRLKYFGQIFGLACSFDYRSLSVSLNTKIELPLLREMRLAQMRSNIDRIKGTPRADTVFRRNFPFFHFGMADWSVIATQQLKGPANVRVNLALGAILAGGETNVTLNYSNNEPFTEKQQQYLWHYVNNDNKVVRQVLAGKIATRSIASVTAPVVGVAVTNTPTTFRRSFCTYTLSDYTEPGWIVELYVNYVLVDFVKADASGFFTFEVPMLYGNSVVRLRFYGPWGEERYTDVILNVPYNFLPPSRLEYTVSAGMVEDGLNSRFGRAAAFYGINRRITIGAGVEYLSSVVPGNTMPFVNLSLRLFNTLLISGEYTYGVRARGILSYRMPRNLLLELNYTRYEKNQTAINNNYLEERRLVLSMPLRSKNLSAFFRLTLNQIILPFANNTSAELLISGSLYGVSTNLTTYAFISDPKYPSVNSNLSLGFRLPAGIIFTPQVRYEYTQQRFIAMKFELEKQILRNGVINLLYEQNFASNIRNLQIGLRYDFSFAQTALTARFGNVSSSFVESARGSILADKKTRYLGFNNRTSVGRGGIVVLPYLDINNDGRRDKGEPRAYGLAMTTNGGYLEQSKQDTTIRIFDLEPYTNYLIELNPSCFDNVAWQIKNRVISIAVTPNQFKLVEVPVSVMGEVSGIVNVESLSGLKGIGRILVSFYRSDSTLAARTLTEEDGYFNFLGLPPGNYFATMDASQMKKLQMTSQPGSINFTVNPSLDGDIREDLDFVVRKLETVKDK